MKNILKQLGKAACYYILFLGMQVMATFVFSFIYGFKVSMEAAVSGISPDTESLAINATEYMMKNLNLIALLSGCMTILALWIFFLIRKKKLGKETGIAPVSVKSIPYIVVLGIAVSVAISMGLTLLPESWLEAYASQSNQMIGDSMVIMVIANIIIAPITEELIFRGLILSRLRTAMPFAGAAVISSLLFGIAHGQIIWVAYTFVVGMILSVVVLKTESLSASILLHMVFNLTGIALPMLLTDTPSTVVTAIIVGVASVVTVLLLVGLLGKNIIKTEE